MSNIIDQHEAKARAQTAKIYQKMSPSQKWNRAQSLRQTAWALKKASIKAQHPDWSDEQVDRLVKKIFLYAVS